jgi:hypothetical protein
MKTLRLVSPGTIGGAHGSARLHPGDDYHLHRMGDWSTYYSTKDCTGDSKFWTAFEDSWGA